MSADPFGSAFPKLFAAAILQEVSFVLMVHFPGYLDRLGITESVIGALYAAAAALALLLRPGFGRLLDLTHRRTVLLTAGALNAVVVLAMVSADVWGGVLWALFLTHRVLQIGLFTTMFTYAADAIPIERRTQGLALFGLSGLLPIAIGGVLGDVVVAGSGFDGLFVLSSLAGLVSWLIVWRLPMLQVLGRRPRRGFWAAFTQRDLLPLWLVTLCFSAGLETLFTFTRTYVTTREIGSTGLFFGIYGVAAASMRIFGGRRYDRVPKRPLVVGSIIAYSIGLTLMATAPHALVLAAAALACGLAHGALFPVLSSQVISRARTAERGSAMATFTSIFDVALLVAAPAIGALIDGFGYTLAFIVLALALAGGAVVYAVWDRRLAAAEVSLV